MAGRITKEYQIHGSEAFVVKKRGRIVRFDQEGRKVSRFDTYDLAEEFRNSRPDSDKLYIGVESYFAYLNR